MASLFLLGNACFLETLEGLIAVSCCFSSGLKRKEGVECFFSGEFGFFEEDEGRGAAVVSGGLATYLHAAMFMRAKVWLADNIIILTMQQEYILDCIYSW